MERNAWNRPMVTDFWNKLCKNSPMCKDSTCKQYAYSLAFLKKHLGEKFEDPPTVLKFLNEPGDVKITTAQAVVYVCAEGVVLTCSKERRVE